MPPALPVSRLAGNRRSSWSEVAPSEAAYFSPSCSALASRNLGASWTGSNRPPLSPIAFPRAFGRRPDVEVEAILTHCRRRLAWHRHTRLHTRRSKRIRFTRASPGCNTYRRPPTQVAYRRGSKWNAFVDIQSAFAHPGHRAGFRKSSLCQRNCRYCQNGDKKWGP